MPQARAAGLARAEREHAAAEHRAPQDEGHRHGQHERSSTRRVRTAIHGTGGKVTASSFTQVAGTLTVCWSASHLAAPRATPSMPSVAMNGHHAQARDREPVHAAR